MGKTAFIFAGQGSQTVGMSKDISEKFPEAAKVFDLASDALGIDMREMIFNSTQEELNITENTQPAVVTATMAIYNVLKSHGIGCDMVAGLSLGEYSAHVAAGSLEFSDAVKLVRKRGKYMQEEVPVGVGGMAAILNLKEEQVIEVCKEAGAFGLVEPANFNCPGQTVISGEKEAIEKACEIAKEKGAKRAIQLAVSAPFHCSMLKGAGEKLQKELENVQVKDMEIPVITNVTGSYIEKKEDIKKLLVQQVSSPVLWEKCVRFMIDQGVDTFVEIGPGKALSGFVKKIDSQVKILNVEDISSLENTLNILT